MHRVPSQHHRWRVKHLGRFHSVSWLRTFSCIFRPGLFQGINPLNLSINFFFALILNYLYSLFSKKPVKLAWKTIVYMYVSMYTAGSCLLRKKKVQHRHSCTRTHTQAVLENFYRCNKFQGTFSSLSLPPVNGGAR